MWHLRIVSHNLLTASSIARTRLKGEHLPRLDWAANNVQACLLQEARELCRVLLSSRFQLRKEDPREAGRPVVSSTRCPRLGLRTPGKSSLQEPVTYDTRTLAPHRADGRGRGGKRRDRGRPERQIEGERLNWPWWSEGSRWLALTRSVNLAELCCTEMWELTGAPASCVHRLHTPSKTISLESQPRHGECMATKTHCAFS